MKRTTIFLTLLTLWTGSVVTAQEPAHEELPPKRAVRYAEYVTAVERSQMKESLAPEDPTEPWSLEACILYAIQHNINVGRQVLEVAQSENRLNTAQNSRLPDLNASVGANLSFGRSLNSNNTYSSNNNQMSGSLGVSASVPLFLGGRIRHEVAGGQLGLAAALQDLERAKEDVSLNVMTLYLEVLFSKELVGVAERQLELSTEQVERSREEVAAGRKAESDLYEKEALMAADELELTQRRNNLSLALLNLSQALNRPANEPFDIIVPEIDSIMLAAMQQPRNPGDLLAYSMEYRPAILAERARVAVADRAVRQARAARWPQLSLTGGYGTNLYHSYAEGFPNEKFWTQFKNNSTEYIGLTLNIPLFNRLATRNNIRAASLDAARSRLTLTEAEQNLRKEIETAYFTAEAARAKYASAEKALRSARTAFVYEERKMEAGRATTFDYNDARTRMERAESDLVQAKFELIFRTKILDFYGGAPLTL